MTGAAIVVTLFVIWIGRSAWKKGNAGAKLATLMAVVIVIWAMVALSSLHAAALVAGYAAEGVVGAIHGLAALITAVL